MVHTQRIHILSVFMKERIYIDVEKNWRLDILATGQKEHESFFKKSHTLKKKYFIGNAILNSEEIKNLKRMMH